MINVILIDSNPDFLVMMRDRLSLLGSKNVHLAGVLASGADLDAMLSLCHADVVAICDNALDTRSDWTLPPGIFPILYTRKPYPVMRNGVQLIYVENTAQLLHKLESIDMILREYRNETVKSGHTEEEGVICLSMILQMWLA